MDAISWSLVATAASVALIHTALGPDHWVPFTVLARSRSWSTGKTLAVVALCGLGHVGSSVALGAAGVGLGWELTRLAGLEGARGELAAWALVAFGAAYALWGARLAVRGHRGFEPHEHEGRIHIHAHGAGVHTHVAAGEHSGGRAAFWWLFVIFVLGPCEPILPLFVIPASRGAWGLAAWTAAVFTVVTLVTMAALVALATRGLARARIGTLERWSHAMAGGAITACGLAVILLGL